MSKVSSTCNICKQRPPWNINHGAEGVLPLNLAIEVNYHEILERVKSPQGSKRSTVGYFCPTAFQNGLTTQSRGSHPFPVPFPPPRFGEGLFFNLQRNSRYFIYLLILLKYTLKFPRLENTSSVQGAVRRIRSDNTRQSQSVAELRT